MTNEDVKTLLLVDDEPLVALTEKATLERFGYRVVTVTSGERAIEFVDSNSDIDLILMDIDLGEGMDGTEAAEHILSVHDIPLVFISSHTEPEYVERTEGITSYGYIVKNSGDTVLRAAVIMAFRLYNARRNEKRKEEQLERYFDSSLDLLCISDMQGRFLRLNPEWKHVLGRPVSEIEGCMFSEFSHPDDVSATHSVLGRLQEQGNIMSFENRLRRSDGSYRWIEWRARVMDGQVYAAGRDITDQKTQSLELEAEKKRFERLFRNAPIAIVLVESDDRVVQCNKEFSRLFGYAEDEVTGQLLNDRITPSERFVEADELSHEVLENGEPLYRESQRVRKDGVLVDVAITGTPLTIHGKRYAYGIYQDITKRKEYERKLRESETKFRTMTENAFDAVAMLDLEGNYLYINSGELSFLPRDPENTIGQSALDDIHPDDRERARAILHRLAREQHVGHTVEFRVRRKGGTYAWMEYRGVLLPSGQGQGISIGQPTVLLTGRDITRRKAYEEQIKRLLDQKDMLLKESHHRTKNQLAAISSLLLYEAGRQSDANTTEVLTDAASRVQGIMLLYDKLYRSDSYDHISGKEYIDELVRDSVRFNDPSGRITTSIKVDDFLIGPGRLAPLGMILNELVTNSVKHAFSDETGGTITVKASLSNDLVHLEYLDNGIGFPNFEGSGDADMRADQYKTATGDENENLGGFGRRLIAMLSEELGGTLYTESASGGSAGGVRYVLEFAVP